MTRRCFPVRWTILVLAVSLSACGSGKNAPSGGGRGGDKGPPEVGFVVVQPSSVPIVAELAGRTAAFQSSEVRPQVSGLIRSRNFVEGSIVKKGQTLYRIDPSLYAASASQAQANLASAAANADATRIRAERYRPLAEIQAVAAQDYTDAAAQAKQANAAVAQSRAQLETARINLRFTTVPAPITGRIGRSLFTEGALVTASQTDPLAVIQRLDPIYVDIQQSSGDLLRLRRALASGGATPARAVVRLTLEDGTDYGAVGDVQFSEAVVNEATGTVTLRARFPNAQGLLLPGMFVRASFAQSIDQNAFLVPQQAVSRDPKGNATVFLVGATDAKGLTKAISRTVVTTRTSGTNWVVTSGLKPGDRVIVQGVGKVKPDAQVKPVAANSPQRIKPAAKPDSDKPKS